MQVLIKSDNSIQMHSKLSDAIGAYISNVLRRFEPYLIRVDVHLTGENNAKTANRGPIEKRCLLKAPLGISRPLAPVFEPSSPVLHIRAG